MPDGRPQSKIIVVTGCDANHHDLAAGLLLSLRAVKSTEFSVGFVDIDNGTLPEAIASNADRIVHVSRGDFVLAPTEGFLLAYLAVKARLPDLFPGYDTYIWLDADTWIQREAGLDEIAQAAQTSDIAVHPQIDPNYFSCLFPDDYTLATYRRIYGEQDRNKFSRFPMINAGVFGATHSSPLWEAWRASLDAARDRSLQMEGRFFSDQIPLHKLIYQGNLRVCPLRAVNNWLALHCRPRFDEKSGLLTAPSPPFEPINIVHLVGGAKSQIFSIKGKRTSLRYQDFRKALSMPANAPEAPATARA